jgi:hypothetical protein
MNIYLRIKEKWSHHCKSSNSSRPCHLLGHEKEQLQIGLARVAEKAAELGKDVCVFARITPHNVVGSIALREIRYLGWFFAFVEELVHRDFEGAGELLKRLNRQNCVAVFNTRDVASKQSGSLFDIAL